jgi:hypothetical protein
MLSRGNRPVAQHVRISHKGWDASNRLGKPCDTRSKSRKKFEGIAKTDIVGRRPFSGQGVVASRIVIFHVVMDAADLGPSVELRSPTGQVLADGRTGNGRRDGLELPTDSIGCIWLHIERIDMARAPVLMQKDHALGSCLARLRVARGAPDSRKVQPTAEESGESKLAGLQQALPTVDRSLEFQTSFSHG